MARVHQDEALQSVSPSLLPVLPPSLPTICTAPQPACYLYCPQPDSPCLLPVLQQLGAVEGLQVVDVDEGVLASR